MLIIPEEEEKNPRRFRLISLQPVYSFRIYHQCRLSTIINQSIRQIYSHMIVETNSDVIPFE